MNKKSIISLASSILITFPVFVLAIDIPPLPKQDTLDAGSFVNIINSVFAIIWPIFVAISIGMFIYAGYLFLSSQGDPSKISTAKKALFWGVVGTVVAMFSAMIPWAISNFIG